MTSRRVLLQRSMWAGGQRRRSPRISALDAWRRPEPDSGSAHKLEQKEPSSRATTTRDRIKRKRRQVHAVASPVKGVSQVEDGIRHKDESINCGKASIIPEKQVLEHILDTLQRRDTYEIFAEPVDPDEVVDYYEIIKEPMDFGTMRAKLHEGMYENLEQFKHDVFLITKNAMHFNSSSTIYFRQARAIHELSKRVFNVLETDPENFESEFLGTRRRSARRAQIEAKDCRLSADVKPISFTTNASSKDTPCSVATSVLERNSRGTPKSAAVASLSNTRNNRNFFLSARDRRRSNIIDTDRRCTYRPQRSSFHSNDSLLDSNCFNSKPLLTNDQSVNYRESLLLFIKDLGPTAQMIATQKIQGLKEDPLSCQAAGSNNWVQATKYQAPAANAPSLSASNSLDAFNRTTSLKFTNSISGRCSVLEKTAETIDLSKAEEQEEAYSKERTSRHGAFGKEILDYSEASSLPTGVNILGAPRRGRVVGNLKSTEFCLGACSSDASARDLNPSIVSKTSTNAKSTSLMVEAGRLGENVRPVILALEHSHANSSESKWRNKKSCTPSTWFSQSRASASHINGSRNSFSTCNQAIRATEEKNGGISPHEARQSLLKQPITTPKPPPVSGFTFDMHFLKAKLNQMKVAGRDRELNKQARYQTSLDGERGFIEQESYGYRGISNNSSCSRQSETSTKSFPNNESLDTLDAKLALQL